MRYKRSSELFRQASRVLPGGVNSPVRAFKSVGGTPVFVREAAGSRFTDEDGNEYIDFIASWGPLLFGHAFPPVVEAVTRRAQKGTSFGMPTALETEVAELAVSMVPGIEKIRFVNSGTEACMSVIRLARGYTGREKIIKFAGCYHGHADAFLIEAGSGAVTFGSPNSPGVTQGTARDTLLARYNDLESVKGLFEANPGEVAAVILEPVAGNMGCIPPEPGFLEGIRQLCTDSGALLIFDEVMTGFRLAAGGAQEALGISADLVAFGKVIGGGLPVGAFGGPAEIMSHLAPEGPVYQAGTLSGNPLAMGAGLAMLRAIEADPEVFSRLESKTAYLHEGLEHVLQEAGHPYRINRFGSMISVHFSDREVRDFESAATGNNDRFRNYFHGMLNRGVYLPPSAFESYFLNDALTAEDLDLAIDAAAGALKD
ncbi:glutamate-1-semialdehyde 2,1-aminomutase [Robiginitalea biformata]|uniref:Glutamate-1-semialdehyde 2,1-aminomutase n=1 Tax=Robiginitalea biformata (strain ATCC BAA-864 / DSM 15991 / KCTC 12146 / HTCC2501) TaxID=313596 RepID=A4CJH1_ROBBH|nr:glutamate-1-semialdehyde 2,1-aminomutase [Robiginitalea biformata]EAR17079.1 glutamate-1-semialdehyde-2,1-aminomutase [Robiginitalea biformata HTCC2501]